VARAPAVGDPAFAEASALHEAKGGRSTSDDGRRLLWSSSFDLRGVGCAVSGLSDTPRLAYSRKQAAEALGRSLRHFQRDVQPRLRCVYSGQLAFTQGRNLSDGSPRTVAGGRAA
jgi:hypothetical protein